MKKIFITGSCGFLFSNFIRKSIFQKLDYNISSIDSISNNILSNVYQNKNHSFYIGNCSDDHLLNIIFLSDNPDIIIHGAFDSNLSKNLEITTKLLERSKNKKFIYISSDEVYGQSNSFLNENSTLNPSSSEGISKLLCENLVKDYCKINKINYNIIRVSNYFGPRQSKNSELLKAFQCFTSNQKYFQTENKISNYGYVADAVNGIVQIIDSNLTNEVFNLSGDAHSFHDVLTELEKILEVKDLVVQSNNTNKIILDNSKLKSIGWQPEFNLSSGLTSFAQWYLNNKWWFK